MKQTSYVSKSSPIEDFPQAWTPCKVVFLTWLQLIAAIHEFGYGFLQPPDRCTRHDIAIRVE